MKQNKVLRIILIVIIILTILTTIIVISTYASYTNLVSEGQDIALIARWNIEMNALDNNFFEHDYILNLKDENNTKTLVPGVHGSSTISLSNSGDVDGIIKKIIFKQSNDSEYIPLKFSLDGMNWSYMTKEGTSIDVSTELLVGESKEVTKIYWEWPLDGNDVIDTVVGLAAANGKTEYKLAVSVITEQLIK